MRKSHSEGAITRRQSVADTSVSSSEGTSAMHGSLRRVVSLENSLSLQNHCKNQSSGRLDQNQIDDVDSNFKLSHKVMKRLVAESSSSNSSNATILYSSGKESQKEVTVEAKPSSSVHEKNSKVVMSNSVDSMPLKKGKASSGAVNQTTSFDGYDSQDECLNLTVKQPSTEKAEKQSQESCLRPEHEPKEALMLSKSMASTEPSQNVFDFDLNADLELNEVEIPPPHSADQSIAAHCAVNGSEPIAVMAKIGVPSGSPSAPLQFEGLLGWRRSSSTSAFRHMFSRNCSDRKAKISDNDTYHSDRGRDFDLNVALSVDRSPMECDTPALTSDFYPIRSSVEASPRKLPRLSFDLNCGDERGNDNHLKLQKRPFDLNEELSCEETCNHVHQPGQSSQPLRPHESTDTTTMASSREGVRPITLGLAKPAYWVGFSSIPSFTHIHAQPFLVASGFSFFPSSNFEQKQGVVPLQPKVAFPPGAHPGFYMGAPNTMLSSLYAQSILPHMIGQPESTTIIPQLPCGEMLATHHAGAGLHLFESRGSQGLNSNGGGYMSMLGQSYFLNNVVGTASVENVNKEMQTCCFMGTRNQFDIGERMALAQRLALLPPTSDREGG